MAQYVTRFWIGDDCGFDERVASATISMIEPENPALDTGLLDAEGRKLYRVRAPIGFIRDWNTE